MRYLIILFFLILSFIVINPMFAREYYFEGQSGVFHTGFHAGYSDDYRADTSLEVVIAKNINLVLSFVGVIFVILIIYSGIVWMTASGNEEKVNSAKKIMTDSIIGLIIVVAAYAITYFILEFILDITWDSSNNLPDN